MFGKKQKDRVKLSLLVIYGLTNTFEQWCRILLPFSQWQLRPRPSLFDTLMLNSIGSAAMVLGSFMIAQLIDTIGSREAAVISTIVIGIYQTFVGQIENYYFYGIWQTLLLFNHMPTIVEAIIGQMIGEDGDEKERSRLIMRLTIPASIAFAAGPYLAIQVLYLINPSLGMSQSLCGIFNMLTVLPIIFFVLPNENSQFKKFKVPTVNAYFELLRDSQFLWTLLFVFIVTAPYNAYDSVLRTQLSTQMLTNPGDMAKLALLLGAFTLFANIFVLPRLQQRFGPQTLLLGSLIMLFFIYLYLSWVHEYMYLLFGLPLQIMGVCVANGLLTAQLMGNVPRTQMGKAAALNRIAQLAAMTMTPLITGYYIDGSETAILCYTSAVITLLGVPIVYYKGEFMRQTFSNLPIRTHAE
uniref:MFS transporter n=1 Tax=Panagrolaimus sp. JU765 TaxID=591449 RepID=A0AC34QXH4_9BILA